MFIINVIFCCAKFSMTDDIYKHLDHLVVGMISTIVHMKYSGGDICNRGIFYLSPGAYLKMYQILILFNKP